LPLSSVVELIFYSFVKKLTALLCEGGDIPRIILIYAVMALFAFYLRVGSQLLSSRQSKGID